MCNNTIKIQGHKIQFNIQGQIGCYRDFFNVKRKLNVSANTRISEELVEADKSQKVDVVSNDTQTVNVEPSKRLKVRCDELNVGMLFMSLKKPVEIRVTVAPVSISKFVITPFTFALIVGT
jgi:hypothetical protein